MKKQLLSLAILCLSVLGSSAQLGNWVPQATGFPNTSTGVFNVSVCDSNTVWISSYDGSGGGANYLDYSYTIDGGSTWIPGVVSAPTGYAWSEMFGLDGTTAWALLYDGINQAGGGLFKTTDGGATWTQQGVGTIFNASSFPDIVHFWNANEGVTMGDPNGTDFEIYTTTDGGTTWVPVPGANIPNPLTGEYGIVNHYCVLGNTIWFDTNKGRVYKSVDKGLNWTVSATGITVPATGAIDVVFYDANNGIARLYNATTGVNTVKRSTDGGATWTTGTVTGNMWGSDLKYVPGTTSRLVSTGAATGFIGSSYSNDGGLTWTDIETLAQRTALGVWNASTMWAGGFTTSPTSDGIYKFEPLVSIACGDPNINPGTPSVNNANVCFGDTLVFTNSGAYAPNSSGIYGYGVIVSTIDLSNNPDPLNQGGIVAGTGVSYPAPDPGVTSLINDFTIITMPGVYYFTPVVFANASGVATNVTGLTMDPSCTYTGTSVMVTLLAAGDPACAVGIQELNGTSLQVSTTQSGNNLVNVSITSAKQSNAVVNVYDLTGRVVISKNITIASGTNIESLDVTNLASGTYVIKVNDGTHIATSKMTRF